MEFEAILGVDLLKGLPMKFLRGGAVKFYNIICQNEQGLNRVVETGDDDTHYEFLKKYDIICEKIKAKEEKTVLPHNYEWIKVKREKWDDTKKPNGTIFYQKLVHEKIESDDHRRNKCSKII